MKGICDNGQAGKTLLIDSLEGDLDAVHPHLSAF